MMSNKCNKICGADLCQATAGAKVKSVVDSSTLS